MFAPHVWVTGEGPEGEPATVCARCERDFVDVAGQPCYPELRRSAPARPAQAPEPPSARETAAPQPPGRAGEQLRFTHYLAFLFVIAAGTVLLVAAGAIIG